MVRSLLQPRKSVFAPRSPVPFTEEGGLDSKIWTQGLGSRTALRPVQKTELINTNTHTLTCLRYTVQIRTVQSLRRVRLFATPWTAARQAFLSTASSQSLLKLMSIELVMQSNLLILCHPLLLPPSVFPSIRVFSNESVLPIRWPKYWSFSFSINPSNEYSGLISFRMDWLDHLAVQETLKSLL